MGNVWQASDLASTSRSLVAIVTICKDSKDWGLLNEQVLLLSKKHGQLKQAITKMVQVVMGFLDETPDTETKLAVIETLRTVTEGKVSVVCATIGCFEADSSQSRSLSKSKERVSPEYCQTSRKSKGTLMLPLTFCASSKSRPLGQWNGGRRRNLSSNRLRCV